MNFTRRQALLTTLFGAGAVGLRALATGLPASFLLDPRKALADNTCPMNMGGKAQFFIMSTSGGGDPWNANCPGAYLLPELIHPQDATMAATPLSLRGKNYTAAKPWAALPQNVLDRTAFFHMATNTPIHPKEPDVLQLLGATQRGEMLPSLLAKAVWPGLCTIQQQPVSVGASPSEVVKFDGAPLPNIPPQALKDTLLNPAGPLSSLQKIRDNTMKSIHDIYKNQATPPQQQFLDSWINTQDQVRQLNSSVLMMLEQLSKDPVEAQIQAAIALIRLKVTPVVTIHIPFGGDNHGDPGLAKETEDTTGAKSTTGVPAIAYLMSELATYGLSDTVSFFNLNVFGRTYVNNGGQSCDNGRNHNGNSQVSVCIGKPFKGGVIGGVAQVKNSLGDDYGATSIDSTSGAMNGDIMAADTMAAFGMTMLQAVGGDPTVITSTTGKVVQAALA